jgi:hypothetical protein
MTLEKFLDIVLNHRLFFTNATRFTDKNEGTLSELTQKSLHKKFMREGKNSNDASFEVMTRQMNIENQKQTSYLNCWTIDHDESYALWKIYLSGSKSGIAIKTNVKKLIDSFTNPTYTDDYDIYLEKVVYEDFIGEPVDLLGALTTKRKCYKYETELRLILRKETTNDKLTGKTMTRLGITSHINPEILIDQIYLSPFAGKSFNKIIKQTLELINPVYVQKIMKSEIDDS